jgi:formamidopyrimidine-DNA glycosylase
MTGNFYVVPDWRLHSTYARVFMELATGRGLIFDDPRVFGRVQIYGEDEIEQHLGHLGIEPLSKAFTVDALVELARGSRKPAKIFLMDQTHVVGVGNMYAAEVLFRARISPTKSIETVRRPKLEALHRAVLEILREAIKVAVTSYSKPGDYQNMEFAVYGRKGEPCNVCKRNIERMVQGGRATYYCPRCQK